MTKVRESDLSIGLRVRYDGKPWRVIDWQDGKAKLYRRLPVEIVYVPIDELVPLDYDVGYRITKETE